MNRLDAKTRARILQLLCEGTSMRWVSRIVDVSINTVSKLLMDAGRVCAAFHDSRVRGLSAKRVQCDEIWSFTYAKQKNVPGAKKAPEGAGDTWTWMALDTDSKLIVSWLVGGRSAEYACIFMEDVAERLAKRAQLTTDGHKAYLEAVESVFGANVDYAHLVKLYGEPADKGPERKYSPVERIGCKTFEVSGRPNPEHISTSHVESQNLTMRMHMRRFTRLTNGFSKKFEKHVCMVALYTVFYNFVKVHRALRVTPALEAGIADTPMMFEDIVGLIDAAAPAVSQRRLRRVSQHWLHGAGVAGDRAIRDAVVRLHPLRANPQTITDR